MEVRKSTIDSLVYFYFGITLDGRNERDKDVIKYLAERAFIDATNQGAFNAIVIPSEKRVGLSEAKKEAREKAIEQVAESLKNYRAKNSREDFKEWHKENCEKIKAAYELINTKYGTADKPLFSFGNAQKLLNMTIKYVYLLGTMTGYENLDNSLSVTAGELLKDESYLDIPIDSFILQAFWEDKQYDGIIELILKDEWKKKWTEGSPKKRYAYSTDKYYSWSTWCSDLYYQVSDKIHSIIDCPITWECDAWIAISKKRKGWL